MNGKCIINGQNSQMPQTDRKLSKTETKNKTRRRHPDSHRTINKCGGLPQSNYYLISEEDIVKPYLQLSASAWGK